MIDNVHSFTRWHFNWHDFFREVTRIQRAFRLLLGAEGVNILFFSGDLELACEVLCRSCHRRVAVSIEESDHQTVFQFSLTKSKARTRPANNMRSLRHRLHPTNQACVSLTKLDHVCAGND